MKKILVTTDFSSNSKAGIIFAIQLALQKEYELVFFHSCYIIKPTSWSKTASDAYDSKETDKLQKKLVQFVEGIYKKLKINSGQPTCVAESSLYANHAIKEYAQNNNFDYICVATNGAGSLMKIFGTNTSFLINSSTVPVIAVPKNYRFSKISKIFYISDLENLDKELEKVIEFNKSIKAAIELLHFQYPVELIDNKKAINNAINKFSKHHIKMSMEDINLTETLLSKIEIKVKKLKPSMIIMFTEQNKSFFDKIFLSSKASEYSFNAKVPLLVFNKS